MKKVIILKGLPASGKTTWAKELIEKNPGSYKRINKDNLRDMLDDARWSGANEKFIIKIRDDIILTALEDGKNVIIDDTNLLPKHETQIRELVKGKAEVVIKFFDIDVNECLDRDSKRIKPVGKDVILSMYNKYIKTDGIKQDTSLPGAYIFDIDGTLALMHNRSPYEFDKVGEDKLNIPVYNVYKELAKNNKIIIFTARDGCCEEYTTNWLRENNIDYDEFRIRPKGDVTKDFIVKRDMLDSVIDKYYIKGIFDDRTQVVDMWRSLGLTCFQVASGDF